MQPRSRNRSGRTKARPSLGQDQRGRGRYWLGRTRRPNLPRPKRGRPVLSSRAQATGPPILPAVTYEPLRGFTAPAGRATPSTSDLWPRFWLATEHPSPGHPPPPLVLVRLGSQLGDRAGYRSLRRSGRRPDYRALRVRGARLPDARRNSKAGARGGSVTVAQPVECLDLDLLSGEGYWSVAERARWRLTSPTRSVWTRLSTKRQCHWWRSKRS